MPSNRKASSAPHLETDVRRREANRRAELERKLDEALRQTFPASDPIAILGDTDNRSA